MNRLAFVAIGRNEGERLKACLRSLLRESPHVVYVDSGSTDGSVEFARDVGADVVSLDTSKPFNMSRGRNAGWRAALDRWPETERIHFIDGDCELAPGWVAVAEEYLDGNDDVSVVCGRRRERFPQNSVYNRLCDIEWNTPVGDAKACGGDALYRVKVLQETGGFNEELIAGEEPELCLRIRHSGGRICRLPADMTLHDANIRSFSQWWRRQIRGGYAAADVSHRTRISTGGREVLFEDKLRSPILWVCGTLIFLGVSFATLKLPIVLGAFGLVGAVYFVQALRIGRGIRKRAAGGREALEYGLFTMIAKWAQVRGIFSCWLDRWGKRSAALIEYKNPAR